MAKPTSSPKADPIQIDDSTLRQFMGYHMKRAFNVIQSDLTAVLKPLELRMLTYTALVLITDNPGLRQSQLADVMDIESPNLVALIDELEGRKLITRERVPTDRRAYALMTTQAGQQQYNKAVAAVLAHEERLLGHLDHDAREAVIAAFRRIETKLNEG